MPVSDIDYFSIKNKGNDIIDNFNKGDFDECYVIYNYFKSVISQEVKIERLLPYEKDNFEVSESTNEMFFDFDGAA